MKLVIVESPYAGDIEANVAYARAALKDSLFRGEAPLASHLLYPQVLDDNDPGSRKLGIDVGLAWARQTSLGAFYIDNGWSNGMKAALRFYSLHGIKIELRSLDPEKEISLRAYDIALTNNSGA